MIWEKFNLYPFPPKNNVAGKVGSQGTRQVSCVGVWGGAEPSVIQFWRKELFAETDAYFYWC